MAAFVKAINAKIRANPMLNYVCSTRRLPSQLLISFPVLLTAANVVLILKAKERQLYDAMLTRSRFLGPSFEFRYPDRCCYGYAEES
jgi:hypothetical protein